MGDSRGKPIDPAALAAATVAVAVGSLFEEGQFGLMDMLVGTALLLILRGYDDPFGRSIRQSCAVAAVEGLAMLVAIGFPIELFAAWQGIQPETKDGSRITQPALFIIWLTGASLLYIFDRRRAYVPPLRPRRLIA